MPIHRLVFRFQMIAFKNITFVCTKKEPMFREFILGFKTYSEAHSLIKKNKLWIFVVFPGLINIILFASTFFIGWHYSNILTEWLLEFLNIESNINESLSFINSIVQWIFLVLLRILFFFFYLYIYKYIVLIIMAPVMAYLSERVETILTGRVYTFNLQQFISDVIRGITLAIRNLLIEFAILFLLFILSNIPIIGWIAPILILIVECYFFGFAMLDYSNERKRLNIKESTSLIYKHKGLAIGNGMVFYLLMLVPVIGLMIGPSYGVIASTIAANKLNKKQVGSNYDQNISS